MSWTYGNKCPVTDEECQEALPRQGDYRELICPTCGRFRISGTSFETIKKYSPDEKVAFLHKAMADAQDGTIPYIIDVV